MPDDFVFNPFDDDTRRNPFPLYARGRREFPIFAHQGLPVASVFRYEDIQSILKDPSLWSSHFVPPPPFKPEDFPEPSMLGQDPPVHTRLRGLVSQAFSPRIIRRLEPRMHEIANGLMDAALEKGEVDFVEAMTYPLPVIVIAEIIGVPAQDRAQFKEWSDEAVANLGNALFSPPTFERLQRLGKLVGEMSSYFSRLADERRRNPQEDLLTGLVNAEVEGSKLTHEEMIRMLILILVAGNETTTTLIGNTVVELLDHPEELARLRANPLLLGSAIDEVLRIASPVQMDPRRAVRDIELHGFTVKQNQIVISWLGSANRDESVFPEPDRFDIGRKDNKHLSFGFGPHYCLGANLARLETQAAIGALLARTKSFERTDDHPLPLHPSIVFRGYTKMPLRLL